MNETNTIAPHPPITTDRLIEAFQIDEETALLIIKLIEGKINPDHFADVDRWLRMCYHRPAHYELIMTAVNQLVDCHGVERIRKPGDENESVKYVNTGQSYPTTVCYDTSTGEYWLGNWESWLEAATPEALESAWDDWISQNFEAEVKTHLQAEICDIHDTGDRFRELFDLACSRAQNYPSLDGQDNHVVCDLDAIAQQVTLDDLKEFGVDFEVLEE